MEILKALEGIRSPFLDTLVELITRLGEETIAIVILCILFWCISKRFAYVIGVAYFLSGLAVQGMKICFRVDRPWVIDPTFNPVESALEHATGYSFPSGHTQASAALYGSIGAQMKNKYIKIACFAITILVAFSRMYLGVHTVQDVVVSLIIAYVLIFITMKFLIAETAVKKREAISALLIIACAVVVISIATVLHTNGTIEEKYASDCLKAAGAAIGFAVGLYIERVYIKFSVKAQNLAIQAVKFIIGFAGVFALKEGLKLIIGTGLVVDTFRYFIMIMWMTVLFPLIIKRFFTAKETDDKETTGEEQ